VENNHIVYCVLGMFVAWGVISALFAPRLPAFTTEAFRQLTEEMQRKRLRKARRAGVTLIVLGVVAALGFGAVEGLTRARLARAAQRLDSQTP
jgi:uncharacterized protein YjeT (DUF2065 family)